MSKKLLIYPFSEDKAELIRNKNATSYDAIIPTASKWMGICERDVAFCDNKEQTGIVIKEPSEDLISTVDDILLLYDKNVDLSRYNSIFEDAAKSEKHLIIEDKLYRMLDLKAKCSVLKRSDERKPQNFNVDNLMNIPVPIIAIMGIGIRTDKFGTLISAKDKLEKDGYKVLAIGSKEYSELFGMESLPEFMFENISVDKKVLRLNYHIYELYHEQRPDVILLEVPGEIMKVSPMSYEGCGELAYIASNALKIDVALLNLYYGEYTDTFIENMEKMMNYRFNIPTIYFGISNTICYYSPEDKKTVYAQVPPEKTKFEGYDNRFFLTGNKAGIEAVISDITEQLSNNI